jgi:hypothetical protein
VPSSYFGARRSAQALERMNRSRKSMPIVFCLMLCARAWFAHAHTLPDADRMVTLELAVRNVETLASQIEAALEGHGFKKVSSMPRMTLDGHKLPLSASVEEGIVLAKFEEKSGLSVFVQVTVCRASFMMRLPGADKSGGQQNLLATQATLVDALSSRNDLPVTVTEEVSIRDNPCVPAVRSNTSLERTPER